MFRPCFLTWLACAGLLLLGGVALADPQDGELRLGTDFRRVYATVLEDWLGLPAKAALGSDFEKLPLFRSESRHRMNSGPKGAALPPPHLTVYREAFP